MLNPYFNMCKKAAKPNRKYKCRYTNKYTMNTIRIGLEWIRISEVDPLELVLEQDLESPLLPHQFEWTQQQHP
jgi:hypothetical protein